MDFLIPVVAGLLGMGVVCALIPLLLRLCGGLHWGCRATDFHHTHTDSVPRTGGLALALAFVAIEIFVAVVRPDQMSATPGQDVVVLGSLAMFALGFLDDLRPIGAKRKLTGQILIALGVWYLGLGIERLQLPFGEGTLELHGWAPLVTVLWLVGHTNLVNLIDGIDGLAGGICLMLMGLLAYIGYQSGGFALLAAGMAGALLGFLKFNFPPARIYLGDGGAYFLGFQIGAISLVNSHKGTIVAALIAPLFVLALPIVDTALAIVRRGMRGLPILRPDRRHIHHRLLSSGFSRRQVVLAIYGVTLVFLVMGLIVFWSSGKLVPVLLGLAALILFLCAGNLSFSREWFSVGRVIGNSLEMRHEVRYALCVAQWLALEGQRCRSVEALWHDLVFAAGKLGFASVRLTLEDGERAWRFENTPPRRFFTHDLQGGRLGILELGSSFAEASMDAVPDARAGRHFSDDNLSEIIGELLAEGWVKAAAAWSNGNPALLRFGPAVSLPHPPGKGRAIRSCSFG